MPKLRPPSMRFRLALLAVAALLSLGAAAPFDPFAGPKPLAVFIQTDPWAMVLGADTPRVAVYENGEVVFVKKVGERFAYHHVKLTAKGLAALKARLAPALAVKDLKPWYNIAPGVTDQPKALFYLRDGSREVATSVYGLSARGTRLPAFTVFPGAPEPDAPPAELLALHAWLAELDFPQSQEWTPQYVEVMLWDYSYAPDSSIVWPREWPSLASPRTVKRGSSYSIFLDGSQLPKLRAFLATRTERGAVEVEGKKMAAEFRYAFPGEPVWDKVLREAAERAAAAERSRQ
jgi:hypothetical protein